MEEGRPSGLVGWMVSALGRRLTVGGWLVEAWNGLLVEQSALLESESWSGEEVVVDGGFSGGGVASSCSVSTGLLLPSRMATSEGLALAR